MDKWLVRTEDSQIIGPFFTETVVLAIIRGALTGEEDVSPYPLNEWRPMSGVGPFYDAVLDAIQKGIRPKPFDERAVLLQRLLKQQDQSEQQTKAKESYVEKTVTPQRPEDLKKKSYIEYEEKPAPPAPVGPPDIIDLKEEKPFYKDSRIKMILWGFLTVLLLTLFFLPSGKVDIPSGKVTLLFPEKKGSSLSAEEEQKWINRGVAEFQKDHLLGYLRTQDLLVRLLEKSSRSAEAWGLLCLTYKQLWPYTAKDTKTVSIITKAAQSGSALDPMGVSGGTCRVVQQTLLGRTKEAAGVSDTVLEANPGAAVFYGFKAEFLIEEGLLPTALAYAEKQAQLWPEWQGAQMLVAQILERLKRFEEAATIYRTVLKTTPENATARIRAGILEFKIFKKTGVAEKLLRGGIKAENRAAEKDRANGLLALAQICAHKGDRQEAIDHLKLAFQLDSSIPGLREFSETLGQKLSPGAGSTQEAIALGEKFFAAGNYLAAQAEFKAAFDLNPKNSDAAVRAAEALLKLNQGKDAEDWLRNALSSNSKNIRARVLLSGLYADRYDFALAVSELKRAQKINPKSHEVYKGWASLSLKRNDLTNAVKSAEAALKLYDTDIEAHRLIAEALWKKQDVREAYNWIARAINLDEQDPETQALYTQILGDFQGGAAGLEYGNKLLSAHPKRPEYRLAVGKLLLKEGLFEKAVQNLNQSVQQFPLEKALHLLLADALRASGQMDESLSALLTAAEMDPSDPTPIFKAGELYLDQKKALPAMKQFERVLLLNGNFPLAHVNIGRAAILTGDYGRAVQESELERRQNPNIAEPYLLAGDAFMAQKQYSKATKEYQLAAKKRTLGADVYIRLARAYRLSNQPDIAIQMLRMASARESGNPEIFKEQGSVFEQKGDVERAVQSYKRYLQLKPNASDASGIRARINNLGG